MAEIVESVERVSVRLTNAELNNLLIQPANDRGFIDFDPTRVNVKQDSGGYLVTFEKVEGLNPT